MLEPWLRNLLCGRMDFCVDGWRGCKSRGGGNLWEDGVLCGWMEGMKELWWRNLLYGRVEYCVDG